MATFTPSDLSPVLREHVNPILQEQYELARNLYNEWGESGEPINERGTRISSRTDRNPSFGWFSDSGALATPGKETYAEMKVFIARCNAGFEFSGDFLQQIGDQESLIRSLTNVLSSYTDTAKKKINQALYGDNTGELGVVVTNDSTTQVTFSTTLANGSLFGTRKLDKNGLYKFFSSAGAERTAGNSGNSLLASKVESTGVGTFDATSNVPTDVAATDVIVHAGSYNKSVTGLKKHVNNDSGVYQGQSRSTYSNLRGDVDDAGGDSVTTARLNKMKYRIRYRIADESAMNVKLLSAPGQFDLYSRIGHNFIRFNRDGGGPATFRQDFEKVQHGNSEWMTDVDCDEDRIYGLNMQYFKRYVLMPFGTFNLDNLDMRMYFSNGAASDKYTGWLGAKFNIGCEKPNANFVIKSLSTTDAAVGFEGVL